jgi:DNA-binding PadR family transcriptional regulator
MPRPQLTSFEQILLGLICLSPASGYDLKRTFAATPMGVYQPSSGALYPALHRLETRGLVRAQSPNGTHESARNRRIYEPTDAGRAANLAWLREPVAAATVAPDLGLHLMRFVMMEHVLARDEILAFLADLREALAGFTSGLARYAATAHPGGHPGLALDHGVAVYAASLQWAEQTIKALSADR